MEMSQTALKNKDIYNFVALFQTLYEAYVGAQGFFKLIFCQCKIRLGNIHPSYIKINNIFILFSPSALVFVFELNRQWFDVDSGLYKVVFRISFEEKANLSIRFVLYRKRIPIYPEKSI